MKLIIFLASLLLAGVFGLTMVAIFGGIGSTILSIVLAVIYGIFIIVAIAAAIGVLLSRRHRC